LEPQGCFVAVEDERVSGTVTTTSYGRELAWIGMMLVHPDERRRGIGTQLMRAALDYLRGRGIQCIRLDATPAGLPVYEKLGFVSEWTLTRHRAVAAPSSRTSEVRDLVEADWPATEQLDTAAFGVSRVRVLRSLAERSEAALVWIRDGAIEGYGMRRPGSNCDYLGPLVCTSPESAHSLIAALLSSASGRPVFWDVPDANDAAGKIAQHFGFEPVRPLTRMRLGPDHVTSDPRAQLGIADPSVG
jgi:predicted GNAT family acetyltransferase